MSSLLHLNLSCRDVYRAVISCLLLWNTNQANAAAVDMTANSEVFDCSACSGTTTELHKTTPPHGDLSVVQIAFIGGEAPGALPVTDHRVLVTSHVSRTANQEERHVWKAKKFLPENACGRHTMFDMIHLQFGPSTVLQFRSRQTGRYLAIRHDPASSEDHFYAFNPEDASNGSWDDTFFTEKVTGLADDDPFFIQHFYSTVYPRGIREANWGLWMAVPTGQLMDRKAVNLVVGKHLDRQTQFRICSVHVARADQRG
ncbi:hypothetical protein BV898_15945 [Hypsibius exemplaris]|uniref:Uncharacterized protein n=1 Tax=Hypsibius exemplaris TaxID=2072580 RepID=A0A9X6NDU9_HYPEX|nr:hypothetical protein BV898_15945 [Hypsibius exemplaris]